MRKIAGVAVVVVLATFLAVPQVWAQNRPPMTDEERQALRDELRRNMEFGNPIGRLPAGGAEDGDDPVEDPGWRRGPRQPVNEPAPAPGPIASGGIRAVPLPAGDVLNTFGFNLYQQLRQKEGNLVYSPYSVHAALLMLEMGAQGQTRAELSAALNLQQLPVTNMPSELYMANFLRQICPADEEAKGTFQLYSPNALWLQKDYDFKQDYLDSVKNNFGAQLEQVDFTGDTEAAIKSINDWVNKATKEKIPTIVSPDSVDAMTRLVITNAIYFKADWTSQFKKESTRPADFTLPSGEKIKTQMMNQEGRFRYGRDDERKVSWVILPYRTVNVGAMRPRRGQPYVPEEANAPDVPQPQPRRRLPELNGISMIVMLPDAADGLPALEQALSVEVFNKMRQGTEVQRVQLALPKFQFDYAAGLNEALQELGIKQAFDKSQSDFTGISEAKPPLFLTSAVHKAMIAVDEKGTEAAAATALTLGATSAPVDEPIIFRADRPFMFAIVHERTGALLFLGRLTQPEKAEEKAEEAPAGDDAPAAQEPGPLKPAEPDILEDHLKSPVNRNWNMQKD